MEGKSPDSTIAGYLGELKRRLTFFGLADAETLTEIEGHLAEAVERFLAEGLSFEDAQRRTIERFGSAAFVAAHFDRERNQMQKVLFALGIVSGLLIAYVDTRPHWDDTGITVFALLASSGLLGLLGFRRPWLAALAVGLWLPIWYIATTHNLTMLITLIFPFIGAYGGWAVRKMVQWKPHTA